MDNAYQNIIQIYDHFAVLVDKAHEERKTIINTSTNEIEQIRAKLDQIEAELHTSEDLIEVTKKIIKYGERLGEKTQNMKKIQKSLNKMKQNQKIQPPQKNKRKQSGNHPPSGTKKQKLRK
jgi:hypothetical protein